MKKLYIYIVDCGDGSLSLRKFKTAVERDAAILEDEDDGQPIWDGASVDLEIDPEELEDV